MFIVDSGDWRVSGGAASPSSGSRLQFSLSVQSPEHSSLFSSHSQVSVPSGSHWETGTAQISKIITKS